MSTEERQTLYRKVNVASQIRMNHDYETFPAMDLVNRYEVQVNQWATEGLTPKAIADKILSLEKHSCSSLCGTRPVE